MQNEKIFDKPLILASQSPRRSGLLKLLGLTFQVHPSEYHEPEEPDLTPPELVQQHAFHKAKDVAQHYTEAWIIGADTVVVLDDTILGKPKDRREAIQMLSVLSGKTHTVYTGFCLYAADTGQHFQDYSATRVTFYPLSRQIIEYYIDHNRPFDKAGSYGIQEFSAIFVERIEGCFYNVMGFPLPKFFDCTRHWLSDKTSFSY